MINRVLIRTKVVQMLYSYLLTQSEFKIIPAQEGASRDAKCAYDVYLATLKLILRLCSNNKYFADSRLYKSLTGNAELNDVLRAAPVEVVEMFSDAVQPLLTLITGSSAYRSYIRTREKDTPQDVAFWKVILSSVIARAEVFEKCARKSEDFSLAGMEKGIAMVTETLDSYGDSRQLFVNASNALQRSLDKAYELYHLLLMLPVEITRVRDLQLDAAKHKYVPTDEDLNPNMRFVDNAFVKALAESADMEAYLKDNPVDWVADDELIKSLLSSILSSKIYADYMEAPETDFATDAQLWRQIMKSIILPSDELAEVLESKSVFWNDDLEIMGTFVLKTIKRFATDGTGTTALLPKYKDDEDAAFGADLFVSAVKNKDRYRAIIEKFIAGGQWDADRVAFMDMVVMITAVTELMDYPAIPIPVTMNEYIEIANSYSTPRSGQFINGILFSVINYLKDEGLLNKN